MSQFGAMRALLDQVVNSFERLEIVVHLFRMRSRPLGALSIGRSLQLPPRSVAEALAALLHAGVVRTTHDDDGGGWWFNPASSWATSVEVLVDLYDIDRTELLGLIKHVGFQATRSSNVPGAVFAFARQRSHRKPPAPS